MRARLALRDAGVSFRLFEVDLKNRPKELYEASPKGTVPVLVLDDGTIIDESLEIVRWALGLTEAQERWLVECDGDFKFNLDRYKYSNRYPGADATSYRDAAKPFLEKLNKELESSEFLFSSKPSTLDWSLGPFIRQFRIADPDWFDAQSWKHLHRWVGWFLNSSELSSVMVKVPPGLQPRC